LSRAPARLEEDAAGADEEFLFHLGRGGTLLAEGDAEGAEAALRRASTLRPRDVQALGLLGQALYKLARYDDAAEVYGRLVDESPAEAAARVNLGLASLKAKHHAQAVRQLEIALDLNPEHKKAMGYLGLAWLEQGDFTRARGWFGRAGSEAMVAKCDELLALAKPAAAAAALEAAQPEPTAAEAPAAEALPDDTAAAPTEATEGLAAFAAARLVGRAGAGPFTLRGERLVATVRGQLLARGEGLLAARGALTLTPEMKRFRGRATEKAFGEGARRMLRAVGEGELLYAAGERRLVPLALEGDAGYFREDAVFALEEAVAFENGRVAAQGGPDLHLVHLRGRGEVLLEARGEVAALEVAPGAPVRVAVAALVGWTGALTPRVGPLVDGGGAAAGEALAVELSGEGRVLVDEGAARER
jgi:uncharacterized protein (AIM24 family)/Tfp pilus assembly protein PilF